MQWIQQTHFRELIKWVISLGMMDQSKFVFGVVASENDFLFFSLLIGNVITLQPPAACIFRKLLSGVLLIIKITFVNKMHFFNILLPQNLLYLDVWTVEMMKVKMKQPKLGKNFWNQSWIAQQNACYCKVGILMKHFSPFLQHPHIWCCWINGDLLYCIMCNQN